MRPPRSPRPARSTSAAARPARSARPWWPSTDDAARRSHRRPARPSRCGDRSRRGDRAHRRDAGGRGRRHARLRVPAARLAPAVAVPGRLDDGPDRRPAGAEARRPGGLRGADRGGGADRDDRRLTWRRTRAPTTPASSAAAGPRPTRSTPTGRRRWSRAATTCARRSAPSSPPRAGSGPCAPTSAPGWTTSCSSRSPRPRSRSCATAWRRRWWPGSRASTCAPCALARRVRCATGSTSRSTTCCARRTSSTTSSTRSTSRRGSRRDGRSRRRDRRQPAGPPARLRPDWRPGPDGPSRALIEVAAAYLESLGERVGRMPEKHLAALLDMLGVSLLPAQPASATLVFTALPGSPHSRVAGGTRVGAQLPGRDQPLPFETGKAVAITSSALAEVWTVLPGSDAAASHGPDLAAGRGAALFAGADRVERQLFLGDPVRLALTGRAELELDLTLRVTASVALELEWSWWDGKAWQPFSAFVDPGAAGDDDSWDGTAGLTRSGRVRLVTPCAQAKPLTVEGIESHWIRARTLVPLVPGPDLRVPEVARVRLATVLTRPQATMSIDPRSGPGGGVFDARGWTRDGKPAPKDSLVTMQQLTPAGPLATKKFDAKGRAEFTPAVGGVVALAFGGTPNTEDFLAPFDADLAVAVDLVEQRGLVPDKAIGDEKVLDLTRSFQPLGQAPARGAAFYLACDEVWSKPGARVTLRLVRGRTAGDEADASGGEYEDTVVGAAAKIDEFVTKMGTAADTLAGLTAAAGALGQAVPEIVNPGTSTAQWYTTARAAVDAAIQELKGAAAAQPSVFSAMADARGILDAAVNAGADPGAQAANAFGRLGLRHHDVASLGADVADALAHLVANPGGLRAAADNLRNAVSSGDDGAIANAQGDLVGAFGGVGGLTPFLAGARPSYLADDPETFRAGVVARLGSAKAAVDGGVSTLRGIATTLKTLDPKTLVTAASGRAAPQLSGGTIAWEYWDGRRWRPLVITGDGEIENFYGSGVIRFDVPDDWQPSPVVNDTRRWLRARLGSGSYSHLRLVSWTDAKSGVVNFLPVVEPRPPVLDLVEVFFRYESPGAPPTRALALNDFQFEDLSDRLAATGPGFTPFRPMPDRAPTLYLGFDGPLPADRLGLYAELAAVDPDAKPLGLTWEGWDGVEWRTVAADDGTRGLTAHGVVGLLWPGDAGPPGAELVGASGRSVALVDRDATARFAAGDRVVVRDARGGEPGVVAASAGQTVTLRDLVSRPYVGGELVDAPPARFGTPRTWLRARFDPTADAPSVALAALAVNATDAWQRETIADEPLGSSDGSPRQVFFARRPPILEGETIEVRELEGARAAVDLPILERELATAGMAGAARAVRDPRSGEISEVWVRWIGRDSLGLSEPGDRHYTVDRAGGRVLFGDNVHGRIPPAAANNVRASLYRSGGGAEGNVGAGAISAMISAVPASKVANPRRAAGGADGETLAAVLRRGPSVLRHRRVAVTAEDAADLAHETCPAVLRARALGARDRYGRPAPGRTRVIVVPDLDEPRPQPDPELRRRVRAALAARAPATAVPGLVVVGPEYVPVGAGATVRARPAAEPGVVRAAVLAELERFLHPLRGGPDGAGFDFGRGVYLSDVARALEALDGVDVITALALTRDGTEQGERVTVAPDQLVCAGPLQATLAGPGE